MNGKTTKLTPVEVIKAKSRYLRGTLSESLVAPLTGAIAEDDTHVSKFHGIYQQDDRDLRSERSRQKLEPAFSFMIRARAPGGIFTSEQWLKIDQLAQEYANGSVRLTTRQTFQLHGVLKGNLKASIQRIDAMLLDTIAACGDVNRNVMCSPMAHSNRLHQQCCDVAMEISGHLTPQTSAYHEIWLDGEKVVDGENVEPIYGPTYLPRKFKMAIAIPPWNDVDVFAHDLGFIAIEEAGQLAGFNVCAGGGMGVTHSDAATYPRLGNLVGFCTPRQAVEVAEKIVCVQRDNGDRGERKHARLKYTIDDRGLEWFNTELAARLGYPLAPARAFEFEHNGDRIGWYRGPDGDWSLGLYIPQGRIVDTDSTAFLSGMRAMVQIHQGEIRFTPNQNLIFTGVSDKNRVAIDSLIESFNLVQDRLAHEHVAMACVAFPTCGLAMAEAERYLPEFNTQFGLLLQKHNIENEPISVRITGCPNGCARPYVAEIALIGKVLGRYNLMLGGSHVGNRVNRMYRENIDEVEIFECLDQLLGAYAENRAVGEAFGDYFVRSHTEEVA